MFLAILLVAVLPALSMGETIYLKDGSSLKGTLTKVSGDTLYVKTSFGGTIAIARESVLRIEFAQSRPEPVTVAAPLSANTNEAPGSLQVRFEGVRLTSTISVHRDRNRPAHARANSLEAMLFVDGKKTASIIDSLTDKVIRKGPEVKLKNTIEPLSLKVALPAGSHRARIVIGVVRPFPLEFENDFKDGPIEKEVLAEDIVIYPGSTTLLRIGMKRRKLGLGSAQLFVIQ